MDLAISQSENVFSARVKRLYGKFLDLESLKVFKGRTFTTLEIASTPCPSHFKVGAEYIFFLKKPVIKSGCEPHFEIGTNSILYERFLAKIKK